MKLLLTSVLFALCPFLASAAAITSGTITITGLNPTGAFNFSGPGFSVSGGFDLGNWGPNTSHPLQPGTALSVDGEESGRDFVAGSATVGAMSFPFAVWGTTANTTPPGAQSIFNVSGPSITLDAGPGTYRSTFSFSGSLCGTAGSSSGPEPIPCLVDLRDLTGSGIVDVNMRSAGSADAALEYTSAVYTFTPEPQTWMLALAGIVAIVGWRRKMA
ncbi:MAG TPA: PEP-CTERM sorting domain-containing protein [Verrucomicrobiae bacterium]|nr:PEP-CTERM sorting domain-containing protein [Verrucomicrobiae bacterium]